MRHETVTLYIRTYINVDTNGGPVTLINKSLHSPTPSTGIIITAKLQY